MADPLTPRERFLETFPDAVRLWDVRRVGGAPDLTAYRVNGFLLVLVEYRNFGWDLLAPVSDSTEIEATFRAAELLASAARRAEDTPCA